MLTVKAKKAVTQLLALKPNDGIQRIELEKASVGDIVSVAGIPDVMIGDSLCDLNHPQQLPPINLDEPTVSVGIMDK